MSVNYFEEISPYKSWPHLHFSLRLVREGDFTVYPEQDSKTFIISYPQLVFDVVFIFILFFRIPFVVASVYLCT